MPCWTDFAPRFGVAYDLFGNARTALKASFNKYMAGQTLGYAQRYNPLRIQSDDRTWRDTNGDDLAQENEIGPSNNLAFGLPVLSLQPDPDGLAREYDLETSVSPSSTSCSGACRCLVRGSGARRTTNAGRTTCSSRTRTTYPSTWSARSTDRCSRSTTWTPPSAAQYNAVDFNSTDSDTRSRVYNGYELGFSGRLHGASFFGGWAFEQLVSVQCDSVDNPNNYLGGALNPTAQVGGTAYLGWCDQGALDIPFDTAQAVRLVHDSVGHPGQRRVAELRRAHPRHLLGHRL